jgi:hypothetical protein
MGLKITLTKEIRTVILISNAATSEQRVIWDKQEYYIMITKLILQRDKNNLDVYAPDRTTTKYVRDKRKEHQGEIDESIIIVGNFYTSLSDMHRCTRQKMH